MKNTTHAARPSPAPHLGLDLVSAALEGPPCAALSPTYLGPQDYPWLRALIDEAARFEGARRSELSAHLQEPLPLHAPRTRLRMAKTVLEQLVTDRLSSVVPPRKARQHLFEAASAATAGDSDSDSAATAGDSDSDSASAEQRIAKGNDARHRGANDRTWRSGIVERVAADLGVEPSGLLDSLFADLPGERTILPLPDGLTPFELALRTNGTLAQSLLARATAVRVSVYGSARAVVRHARSVGLLCVAMRGDAPPGTSARSYTLSKPPLSDDRSGYRPGNGNGDADRNRNRNGAVLHISGPLSLFRHTIIYGRALASLLPRLAWCERFELDGDVLLRDGEMRHFVIRSGDPLPPGRELPRYDSRLEERFARDFARAAPDWHVTREPEPEPVALDRRRLVFPDFELVHRHDPTRRWLLEIVGFWTPAYLEHKLASLRQAQLRHLIVCIDETRNCSDQELPEGARVLRFRRRIDPQAVLSVISRV